MASCGGMDVAKLDIPGNDVKDMFLEFDQCPPHSVLPIENSNAELLFIAGCDDRCVPAEKTADFLEKKMLSLGKTNLKVEKFPGMGHLVDTPFAPPCTISPHIYFPKRLFYFGGGDKRLHVTQVLRVWNTVTEFFQRSLPL